MARLQIDVVWQRRRALYTPSVDKPTLGLVRGEPVDCFVFGCYQVSDGEDVNPYFVIELANGQCTYALPEHIRFVDEEVLDKGPEQLSLFEEDNNATYSN